MNPKCKKHKTELVCLDCDEEKNERRMKREWKKIQQEMNKAGGFDKWMQKQKSILSKQGIKITNEEISA